MFFEWNPEYFITNLPFTYSTKKLDGRVSSEIPEDFTFEPSFFVYAMS